MQSSQVLLRNDRLRLIRFISTTPVAYRKKQYTTIEQALNHKGLHRVMCPEKMMYKLLFRDKKINPFFVKPPLGAPSISIKSAVDSVSAARICDSKRVRVLNKMFMRYIPEIMATSALGNRLGHYDVQISRVSTAPTFNIVDVYWIPTGTEEDAKIQQILDEIAYPLRSELINLRLMGLLPPIRFMKDERIAYMKEIDRLIRIADYGEDYVPSFMRQNTMKKDLQLEIQFPVELKQKLTSVEEAEPLLEEEENVIPPMRTNTFGLEHQKIMNFVKERMSKSRILDTKPSQTSELILGDSAIKMVPYNLEAQSMTNWDRSAFQRYIKKQKIERKKMLKVQNRMYKEAALQAAGMILDDSEETAGDAEFPQPAFPDDLLNDYEDENFYDEQKL